MKRLIRFCKDNGEKFGEKLLLYDKIDIQLAIYFLDLSMPAISVRSYNHEKPFKLMSKIVTVAEEAFAVLVLENYLQRWIWHAEKEALRTQREQNGIEDLIEDGDNAPRLLYQYNVKKRKDNIHTSGKWTDDGKERYNVFIELVENRRVESKDFEERLRNEIVNSIPEDNMNKKRKKKDLEEGRATSSTKRKVVIKNTLNLTEL